MSELALNPELVIETDRRFLDREIPSKELLELTNTAVEYQPFVRVLNRNGNLVLLHYLTLYEDNDSGNIDEDLLKKIGHLRGIIVDTETNEIVCRSYPHTPEIVIDGESVLDNIQMNEAFSDFNLFEDSEFYNSTEGTVLRYFWNVNGWCLATHRNINANNSYWSGRTFGELFNELKNFDDSHLNKDYCYSFLLSHESNRLVYEIPEPQLMLITIYDRLAECFLKPSEFGSDYTHLAESGVKSPQLYSVKDAQDLFKYLNEEAFNRAGLIMISDHTNPAPIKFVSQRYAYLRSVRGNDPSLRSRYIQLRGTPKGEVFTELYHQYQDLFNSVEDEIDALVEHLHNLYVRRYIMKDFSNLPKEEFVTLQRCHSHYRDTREKMTKERVAQVLSGTPNHFLLIMLNRKRRNIL